MDKPLSRRRFVKNSALGLAALVLYHLIPGGKTAEGAEPGTRAGQGNTLIVYFSHSGNTRYMAGQIHEKIAGDTLEVKTVNIYSENYDTVVEQAKQEQNQNARPKLSMAVPDLSAYDTIFVGYPNWWGTMPMALFTFFEKNDLSGKTLIPFSTHEGSVFGRSVTDMQRLNPKSRFLDGLAIRGRSVRGESARQEIAQWLAGLKVANIKSR
jgi:flavodoxin